jgi:hypothetical protein
MEHAWARFPRYVSRAPDRRFGKSGGRAGEGDRSMIEGVSLFAVIVVAFVVITVLMGVRQVPQGFNYTVERFGKYNKTRTSGLGLIFPYVDSIGRKLNVMEQVIDLPR